MGSLSCFFTDSKKKEQVAEYVAAGNTAQFADKAWVDELKSWIRFNARDAIDYADGLYGPVMGNPDVPAWLGQLFMRLAFSAKNQNRKDISHIRHSSAIAVLYSEMDDKSQLDRGGPLLRASCIAGNGTGSAYRVY